MTVRVAVAQTEPNSGRRNAPELPGTAGGAAAAGAQLLVLPLVAIPATCLQRRGGTAVFPRTVTGPCHDGARRRLPEAGIHAVFCRWIATADLFAMQPCSRAKRCDRHDWKTHLPFLGVIVSSHPGRLHVTRRTRTIGLESARHPLPERDQTPR